MEDVENIFNMMPSMSSNKDYGDVDPCDKFIIKNRSSLLIDWIYEKFM